MAEAETGLALADELGTRYYPKQANSSLTRSAAVSPGVEDDYLDGPEAAGVWTGAAAAALGLNG